MPGCANPRRFLIIRRVVRGAVPVVDPYGLRLSAVVQASFVVSLLLCAACAAVSSAPRKVFGILTLNAVVHLLLDGLQTKWATRGVHFFAPFSMGTPECRLVLAGQPCHLRSEPTRWSKAPNTALWIANDLPKLGPQKPMWFSRVHPKPHWRCRTEATVVA